MRKASAILVPSMLVVTFVGGCTITPPSPPGGASALPPTPLPTLAAPATPTAPLTAVARATPAPSATVTPVPTATGVPTVPSVPTATTVPEVVVELVEGLLTERVNAALVGQPLADTPFGPASVSYVAVQLADGGVTLTGEAQAGWVRLPIASAATIDVADGRPVVHLGNVTVGGVVVPEPVRQSMEQVLQAEVNRAVARDNFQVRTVVIEQGKLTVRGRVLGAP